MDYTYKKIKNFATLLSKELGLQMRIHKEGKTLVCFLREWLDLDPYAWVDINIGTYDKWMQDLHMRREIHGGGDCGMRSPILVKIRRLWFVMPVERVSQWCG